MAKRLTALFLFLSLAALSAFAKPNFTGDWKLNTSKSSFGQFPAPGSMTAKITHEDPSLKAAFKMSSDMGEMEFTSTYSTDGKETSNEMMNNTTKSTAKWDGDTLIIETKGKFGEYDFNMTDKWTLDGKTLTMVRTFSTPNGPMEQKMVLEKQ